ncbi:MAG TPA: PAS domain S-box protein [Deltaproteobacteria bacterium]|nr:PAS domain S-box protein [Deltaproteobacteria bacterium]
MDDHHKTKKQLIEELRSTRDRLAGIDNLSGYQDSYKYLFDYYPDAVFLEAQDGSILDCNKAALRMYGYTIEEMRALKVKDLIHDQVTVAFPDLFDETSTTDGVFVWISAKKKNGTIFPVQYSNQIIKRNGEKRILAFVRDVSEHYWRKHYLYHDWNDQIPWSEQGVPVLSLTWERQGSSFVLIGFDDRALKSTNYKIQNFIGRTAHSLYRDRPDIIKDFERCYHDRSLLRRKTIYKLFTTGQQIIAEITYVFMTPDLIIMQLEDFTARDTAEALNQSLVKSSPVGLCLVQDNQFQFVNPKLQEYTGYTESELFMLNPMSLIHEDDRHKIRHLVYHNALSDTVRKPIELRIVKKQGDIRWAMLTFTSIFYKKKHADLINLMDITELKTAREKLDELASLQSSIMGAIPHAVIGLDNRTITFANQGVYPIFGWKPEELIGKSMRVLFRSRDEYEREGREFYSVLKKKLTHSLEFTYRHRDGRDISCLTSVSRISDRKDDHRIVATHTDITEKRQAEERLRESERVLSTLMGNLPGMAYRRRPGKEWPVEFVSEGSFDLTGYRPADLIDSRVTSYRKIIHPDDQPEVWQKVRRALKTREHFEAIYRIITADNKVRWVWERGMGIYSPDGALKAVEGFITDVTELKRTQQELEQSRRELGIHADHLHTLLEGERTEIAREIHDELGQILTALKMDLFWLHKKLPDGFEIMQTKIDSMMFLLDSTIQTVERILAQLRPAMLDDLGLTSAIEWLAEEFQSRTGVVCEAILEPTPENLITDEKLSTALFRICQECLTNITRHAQASRAEIMLKTHGGKVEMTISDNGIGIRKKDIDKSDSFGILGIKERVNLLGGKVNVIGRRNRGTMLRVRIPLKDEDDR